MSDGRATRYTTVTSADGTEIRYATSGRGPGIVLLGGVLSTAAHYIPLATALAPSFEVHVVDRRGRGGSGPQRNPHTLADECADLVAVLEQTKATAVFGHSFGGFVALETARSNRLIEELVVYEPGIPLPGTLDLGWLEGYAELLAYGDRRGAFAYMVKHNGFAPRPLEAAPLWWVKLILRLAIRRGEWESMDRLLEENLAEHRIQARLDVRDAARYSTVAARTALLGGTKSPPFISTDLLTELARAIPDSTAAILEGLDHRAPQHRPGAVAAATVEHLSPRR